MHDFVSKIDILANILLNDNIIICNVIPVVHFSIASSYLWYYITLYCWMVII